MVVKKWIPALLWMAVIFLLSHQTKETIPSFGLWDFGVKKGAHMLAYGLLASLYWWALRDGKRPFATAFMLTVLYALSDEGHQFLIPGRNATWMDVMIDTAGGVMALAAIRYRLQRKQRFH